MTNETFTSLSELTGSRMAENAQIEAACDVLDELPFTDLLSMLTVVSQTRSNTTTLHEVIRGNRFHTPSHVSPKDFHWLEGIILTSVKDIDFVDPSPLQPFGINHVLASTNQKNIVSALRRSEVNADATTALFRIAMQKYIEKAFPENTIRIGANVRTVRAQVFDPGTNFLPHFKVFGEVTIGKHNNEYGAQELDALINHLGAEVDILDRVASSERSNIGKIHISIGNLALLGELVKQGKIDLAEARRNTINPNYSLIEANALDMPEYIAFDTPGLSKELANLGFKSGVKITEKMQHTLEAKRPDLLSRLTLHLGRVAGLGYYKHMCYKIEATSGNDLTLPVADGGSTDWATKVTNNKQLYSVSSGIGTELVCQYLIN